MHGAFHDAPRTSDDSVPAFRRGRFLPATSTERHPLTLPSPRSACLPCSFARCRAGFRPAGRDPLTQVRGVCERAAETTRLRRPVTDAASTDDPERLPSYGRSLAPRSCPRCVSFPSAAPVSRCCALPRRRRRSCDFCHDDTIVSTTHSKGWCLADSGRPCRRTVQTSGEKSPPAPNDFRHPGERRTFAVAPVPDIDGFLRLPMGGRASRAVDDFHRPCGWLPSSARAESTESRMPLPPFHGKEMGESPYSTTPRASLGHRSTTWEFGERSHATTRRRLARRFAPREGYERTNEPRCFRSSITRSRA